MKIPTTLEEAAAVYDTADRALRDLISKYERTCERRDNANDEGRDDLADSLDDRVRTLEYEIEAAGNDTIAAGEWLDAFTP